MEGNSKIYKIGIYDRYLSTAGGGERYSCKIAELLSGNKKYRVEIVTDLYADTAAVGKKLNIDLSGTTLKVFPFLSEEYAAGITGCYDIFINATYLSSLSSHAGRNIYLCYFPTPFDIDFSFLHRVALLFLRYPALLLYRLSERISKGLRNINILEGVYDTRRFMLYRGSFTSGNAKIVYEFNKEKSGHTKKSLIPGNYPEKSGNKIAIMLKNPATLGAENMRCSLAVYRLDQSEMDSKKAGFFCRDTAIPERSREIFSENFNISSGSKKLTEISFDKNAGSRFLLSIRSDTFNARQTGSSGPDTRNLGVVVYNRQRINFLVKIFFKLLGFIPLFLVTYPENLSFLNTYNRVISISKYSEKWIKKSWNRSSTILYPPVDIENFSPGKKEKIILSVGRFFPQHHNKKQLEMVKRFIELHDSHNDIFRDYRLILAGGVENKPAHIQYVEEIKKICPGYPVEVLTNIGWKELRDLFSRSLIFWHAAGMGEDEDKNPEKFEHFGITTVEAMASGCICVVINKGGQPEIIEDGKNGFLFGSWKELKDKTLDICLGNADIDAISENAVKRAADFSGRQFGKKLEEIVENEISSIR